MSTYALSIRLRPLGYRTKTRHNIGPPTNYTLAGETRPMHEKQQLTVLEAHAD